MADTDLLKDEIMRLLHIPPHIFSVLAMHSKGHHVDRHFATHVVTYRAGPGSHLLINAHPVFAESAFALGLVNEPPDDMRPSLEMQLMQASTGNASGLQ